MPKYHVQVSPVREVSLRASVDLQFWRNHLAQEGLYPMVRDGRASILICAAAARFMGLAFREVSISVAICRQEGGAEWDGAYLVQAFNSRRFFAFVERTMFSTPYQHAEILVDVGLPAQAVVTRSGQTLFRMEMSAEDGKTTRKPSDDAQGGFEGPIFLPGHPAGKPERARLFYGKLVGLTQTYPVRPSDKFELQAASDFPVLQWLIDSHFTPEEWIIRRDATHGKSKTVRRPVNPWNTN